MVLYLYILLGLFHGGIAVIYLILGFQPHL
jgi:hypothetical protein